MSFLYLIIITSSIVGIGLVIAIIIDFIKYIKNN